MSLVLTSLPRGLSELSVHFLQTPSPTSVSSESGHRVEPVPQNTAVLVNLLFTHYSAFQIFIYLFGFIYSYFAFIPKPLIEGFHRRLWVSFRCPNGAQLSFETYPGQVFTQASENLVLPPSLLSFRGVSYLRSETIK